MNNLFSGSLSRKLSLLYGTLCAVIILLLIAGVRVGIEHSAEGIVRSQMSSSAAVFNHIVRIRDDQLDQAARVLAADFGFKGAVATADRPTIVSALSNLKQRLKVPLAIVVPLTGKIVADDGLISPSASDQVRDVLDNGSTRGVLRVGGTVYSVVAVPVHAPTLAGWVVFGNQIDGAQLASLASMASLHMTAKVVDLATIKAHGIRLQRDQKTTEVEERGERVLYQAIPLPAFGNIGTPQALLLRFSLTEALSTYTPMLIIIFAIGILAIAFAVGFSGFLARRIARPIVSLEAATRRLSNGEHVEVDITSNDEIGSLAESFNKMVTAVEDRERHISHLAFHDPLTDLPNRALLRQQIDRALLRLHKGKQLAILYLDLDNFKSVNDTLGHPIGDLLLHEVATRFSLAAGDDLVARLGGDEFAVLITADIEHIETKARGLIDAIRDTFEVGGNRIAIGTSVGIAVGPQDGEDADTLIKNADLALYRAKHDGKGSFRFFEAEMDARAQERRLLELDIRDAITHGQFELFFQPLFGLEENKVTSFEALIRWHHPVRGLVSPIDFIPIAEETGLITPIGEWVIHEACRIAQRWPDDIRVAVNVSAVQFRNPGLGNVVVQALAGSGLRPDRLELEITESLFIEDAEGTLARLHNIRTLGVRFALDDFGTGYSSLSYLRSFPFNKIKIDRSFIIDLLNDDNANAIIHSITSLATALGMETTAEGVEHKDQLDALRAQGCSQIQGYLFSRPVPAASISALITSINASPSGDAASIAA